MPGSWSIVDASSWSVAGLENQGQHPHDWLSSREHSRTWLFKPARPERDRSLGEDVVEKMASELAKVLGVPAAPVELAVRDGVRGALVEDVRPSGWELQAGQVLLPEVVPDYDPDGQGQRGYNVSTVRAALERFAVPPGSSLPTSFRAFDVFAGYLVFDALIAHGDRHDRNWAVLNPPTESGGEGALCASFDHAASLGFTLKDAERADHLRNHTVESWAKKGRASRFEHRPGDRWHTLVDLALSAVELCPDSTRAHWRSMLLSVDAGVVGQVVDAAPDVSEIGAEFTIRLLMVNRERLLDVLR